MSVRQIDKPDTRNDHLAPPSPRTHVGGYTGVSGKPVEVEAVRAVRAGVIRDLGDARVRLTELLFFEIEEDAGYVHVKQRAFDIHEGGGTLDEAVVELQEYIVNDFLELSNTPADKLSDDAKDLLEKYREFIEAVA